MTIRKFYLTALLFVAFFVLSPGTALAKDQWLQVRSKNFFLIGNASEKDIRKAATKLEQFRETFRLLFGGGNLTASVPTTVIVFKSNASYKQFKPKRGDGKIDNFVAGYFQPGDDVNYITLTTEGTDTDTFGTIFHEYVHFVLNSSFGKSEVPPWFNEGLAEYYQTFEIEGDQNVKLGMHQDGHVLLLRENKLIPLGTFFNISNSALHQNGSHSKSIFYAQSWALIHYLTLNGKTAGLRKFLALSMSNKPAEQAFQEAFSIGYAEMEKELRKYVGQGSFKYMNLPLKAKLVFDTEMQVAPLDEAGSNAYLGDLLFHIQRHDDAEPLLRTALQLEPDSTMANTTLGMVKLRQRKYAEAKTHLEKAIARDPKNHIAFFRFAELLSREGRDEFGYVNRFEPATANRIREALKKAISLNGAFTESYELLAFVNLVNNEQLDDAVLALQQALKHQPGNARYTMRIAEIFVRQEKFKEAASIADRLARNADDQAIRTRAEQLSNEIRERQEMMAEYEASRKKYEQAGRSSDTGERVLLLRKPGEERPTPEQLAKATEAANMRALNQSLRLPEPGEIRVLGKITKIDCKGSTVGYSIKTDTDTFQLMSKDFQTLKIMTFVADEIDGEVGCDAKLADLTAILSYKPAVTKPGVRGELIAVEFVPQSFRFIDLDKEAAPPTYLVEEVSEPTTGSVGERGTPPPQIGSLDERRRAGMIKSIADNLRKPAAGEMRELGFIDRSECTNKGIFFYIKSGDRTLKLTNEKPQAMFMRSYTQEVENLQFGCGMKSIEIPVVFVYKPSTDAKGKVAGDLVSLEFVPASFRLEQ